MIEFLGLLYGVAKDIKEYIEWDEKEKFVDFNWPDKSGFQEQANQEGIDMIWSKPDKVESRLLDGYEIMYEVDKIRRVRKKIVLKEGLVLLGKKK